NARLSTATRGDGSHQWVRKTHFHDNPGLFYRLSAAYCVHRHFPVKTLLLILALPIISAAAPTSLQFLQSATQVLTMANGAVLSLGANSLLSINDATGKQIASLPSSALGSESGITAAAIDATGNIWIIGSTQSADFPLV